MTHVHLESDGGEETGPAITPIRQSGQRAEIAVAGPWTLIWLKFVRHKVAVVAGAIILVLYLIALFAEFLAPALPDASRPQFTYAPPQKISFFITDADGSSRFQPHVTGYKQTVDPASLKRTFTLDEEKVVPIGGDFQPGESAAPLAVPAGREEAQAGVLICFEDIFPGLARDSVLAGADFLAVLTNNGWFGEGGAAQQHAAHSVLRAVETRRPVLRCGNGGWSGWIDEYGQIRHAVKDEAGSIYFRGFQTFNVTRDQRWAGRASAYTRHGDWFLAVCAGLAVLAFWTVRTLRVPVRREGESAY